MTNQTQGPSPKQYELKIEALKQALANKVAQYEDQIADLRVALTETNDKLQEALAQGETEEARPE